MRNNKVNSGVFFELIVMLSLILLLLYVRNIFGLAGLSIGSIILFIISYNLYALKTVKPGLTLPLWVFPLAIFISSIMEFFNLQFTVLVLYYIVPLLVFTLISSPRIIDAILDPFKNYFLHIYVILVFIVFLSRIDFSVWIAFGPFAEYFMASYLYRSYVSSSPSYGGNAGLLMKSLLLPICFISSAIVFLELWMILYSGAVNTVKLFLISRRNIVSLLIIIDLVIRFLLLGGLSWITGMLSLV